MGVAAIKWKTVPVPRIAVILWAASMVAVGYYVGHLRAQVEQVKPVVIVVPESATASF